MTDGRRILGELVSSCGQKMEWCLCYSHMGASSWVVKVMIHGSGWEHGEPETFEKRHPKGCLKCLESLLLSQSIPYCAVPVANYRHCEQKVSLIPRTKGLERTRLIIIQEGQRMRWGKLSPRDAAECDPLHAPPAQPFDSPGLN